MTAGRKKKAEGGKNHSVSWYEKQDQEIAKLVRLHHCNISELFQKVIDEEYIRCFEEDVPVEAPLTIDEEREYIYLIDKPGERDGHTYYQDYRGVLKNPKVKLAFEKNDPTYLKSLRAFVLQDPRREKIFPDRSVDFVFNFMEKIRQDDLNGRHGQSSEGVPEAVWSQSTDIAINQGNERVTERAF